MQENQELPQGWVWVTIDRVGKAVTGNTPSTCRADFYGGNIPFFKPSDLDVGYSVRDSNMMLTEQGSQSARIIPERSILVTCIGATIGKTGLSKVAGATNQQINALVPNQDVLLPEYGYFAFTSQILFQQILSNASSTTLPILNKSKFEALKFPLAPLPEQRRIVAKLEELFSRLDAGVALLRQTQAQLKRYRQSVLHAAVTGELTRAWRAAHPQPAESGAALLARIRAERRAQWEAAQRAKRGGQLPLNDAWKSKYEEPAAPETSELPELPEGWAWIRFEQIIIDGPQNGLYLPSSLYGSGTPIVRIDDYQSEWSRSSDKLRLVKCSDDESEKYGLRIGNIVINRVNSMSHIGKSFVVEARHLPAIYESNMMRLAISGEALPAYINIYLRSRVGRSRLTGNAKQAVNQASINQNDVNSTAVPLPSLAEQEQIIQEVESRLSVLDNLELTLTAELTRAERLRQSLLHRAFTGRLVPQNAADESAAALLARLQAAPAAQGKRGRKPKAAGAQIDLSF